MTNRYFITGINTDVGKTVVSALLVNYLNADYWKPVQTGTDLGTDRDSITALCANFSGSIHPESYLFKLPVSPHYAAEVEGEKIDIKKIICPETKNKNLIIEGAGGILVPLNESTFVIDLAKMHQAKVILVIKNYLGCINHSLLSISYLVANHIPFHGIIFNGDFEGPVLKAITDYALKNGNIKMLAHIPNFEFLDAQAISTYLKYESPFNEADWK